MLLVHIEGFLEVARLGSVSRAADVLYVTQPTLTARLQSLERDMGHELFVRPRHGMRLTDEGRAFLPFPERAERPLAAGVQTRSMMELDNIEAAKKMVERRLGVALLPRTAVDREVAAGALRLVRVADAPHMRRTIVAMRRRDSGPPSGLVSAFLELLVGKDGQT